MTARFIREILLFPVTQRQMDELSRLGIDYDVIQELVNYLCCSGIKERIFLTGSIKKSFLQEWKEELNAPKEKQRSGKT